MEKAHDISIDEPSVAHQAILFILDVLITRNGKSTMKISDLFDAFGDKRFTPPMLKAVGGNEDSLKIFLARYPSLFTLNLTEDTVIANSGEPVKTLTPERFLSNRTKKLQDPTIINTILDEPTDGKTMKEIEQEAILFFRKQMAKRDEEWLPLVSVAGHASQASSDVRKYVGPQNEFKSFLLRYPHIFVVREDFCGLKGKADQPGIPFPPPSPLPKRRIVMVPESAAPALLQLAADGSINTKALFHSDHRSNSFKSNSMGLRTKLLNGSTISTSTTSTLSSVMNNGNNSLNNTNPIGNLSNNVNLNTSNNSTNNVPPRLTPIEVKAVHFVMRILYRNGRMLLQNIAGHLSRAPDDISNIIGFTREDLIQFFKRHSAVFQLHPDGCISVKPDAVRALINKDRTPNEPMLHQESGVILRIFPKYGILNMENNEQVFFDIQSCLFETFSDLTTVLHPGEYLMFNAALGPREGSTKWRSLKTWIKTMPEPAAVPLQQSNNRKNDMMLYWPEKAPSLSSTTTTSSIPLNNSSLMLNNTNNNLNLINNNNVNNSMKNSSSDYPSTESPIDRNKNQFILSDQSKTNFSSNEGQLNEHLLIGQERSDDTDSDASDHISSTIDTTSIPSTTNIIQMKPDDMIDSVSDEKQIIKLSTTTSSSKRNSLAAASNLINGLVNDDLLNMYHLMEIDDDFSLCSSSTGSAVQSRITSAEPDNRLKFFDHVQSKVIDQIPVDLVQINSDSKSIVVNYQLPNDPVSPNVDEQSTKCEISTQTVSTGRILSLKTARIEENF
ncbi:hypothetical protein SNEBB_005375 [Seison nebaliae]|nr:hypothetical protein SNEBB_005375 [Seison nebaliae]